MRRKLLLLTLVTLGFATMHAKELQQSYTVEQVCDSPRIYTIENFLSHEECDYLIKKATPKLQRSRVLGQAAGENIVDKARTSSGAFLCSRGDQIMKAIEKRIQKITSIPAENGEDFHILHYLHAQEYLPHFDFFDGSYPAGKACLARGGQRVASFIIYLHDTEKGGETIFPNAGVSVAPVKGNAVLFYNCLPNGDVDTMSLHGGAPVITGEKWIATKWLREKTLSITVMVKKMGALSKKVPMHVQQTPS